MSSAPLDERYGRTVRFSKRQRIIAVLVAAAFAVVLVAWVIWAGLSGEAATLETRDLGHEIVSNELVEVRFELTVAPGTAVQCAVEALNEGYSVVGWKTLDVPAGAQRTRQFTETVRTSELAVTGLIYRCWLP